MTTVALAIALALALARPGPALTTGPGTPRGGVARRTDPAPGRPGPAQRAQHAAGALGAAGCCVLLGGLMPGLAVAAVVAPLVLMALARRQARTRRTAPGAAVALTIDLAAAALRAGQPVSAALRLAAAAAPVGVAAQLRQVAALLRLGAEPAEAWRECADDPILAPVALTACRSADSGARLAVGWEALAVQLRAEAKARAEARAHRAGVFAMAPLGLCFLPAFVCLGVVPVVIGVAGGVVGGLAP